MGASVDIIINFNNSERSEVSTRGPIERMWLRQNSKNYAAFGCKISASPLFHFTRFFVAFLSLVKQTMAT